MFVQYRSLYELLLEMASRLPSRVTIPTIADPYNMLLHYRRGFRVLSEMVQANLKILALGNKYEPGFDWRGSFSTIHSIGGTRVIDSLAARAAVKSVAAGTFRNPAGSPGGASASALGMVTDSLILNASSTYSMILCFDPVLYCKYLRGINLPVMSVVRVSDIVQYPEILQVTDYLMPLPSSKAQVALRQLMYTKTATER